MLFPKTSLNRKFTVLNHSSASRFSAFTVFLQSVKEQRKQKIPCTWSPQIFTPFHGPEPLKLSKTITVENFHTFSLHFLSKLRKAYKIWMMYMHFTQGLRLPSVEIVFPTRPKIKPQSQIFRYGRSISYLPHRPKFSDFFDLCLHWESVVRGFTHTRSELLCTIHERNLLFLASIFFSYLLTVFWQIMGIYYHCLLSSETMSHLCPRKLIHRIDELHISNS